MARKNKRRGGNRIRPIKFNLTIKGDRGRPLRIILCALAAIVFFILAANLFRPKVQLENTAEITRIHEQGVLTVGILDGIPGFSENGDGFEVELACRFAEYLLPDTDPGAAVKLETVTDKTATTKLSDGSVDAVLALMKKGASSRFCYSYPYYTDECIIAIPEGTEEKPLDQMLIGYVQDSASESVLNSYISQHETKVEQSIIDKLLKRKVELPADAITFDKQAFASYPDMLLALRNGRIDGAAIARVYFNKYADEYSFSVHSAQIGTISYSIACAADSPAIAQLADMFIYELRESGELEKLIAEYGIE